MRQRRARTTILVTHSTFLFFPFLARFLFLSCRSSRFVTIPFLGSSDKWQNMCTPAHISSLQFASLLHPPLPLLHTTRKLVSSSPANPWSHAAGHVAPPPMRDVDPMAVRESWRQRQVDIEDCNAVEAVELELEARRKRREEEEKEEKEAEERRRRAREAPRAGYARGTQLCDDAVIDLCDDDDDDDKEKHHAPPARRTPKNVAAADDNNTVNAGGKENLRAPTRADDAAAAAKRRAAANAHHASTTTATRGGGGTRRSGGGGGGGGWVSAGRGGGTGGGNPFLDPPRYIPPSPSAGSSAMDMRLSTDEIAEVRDVGMSWYPCSACLDTGNGGCTLVAKEVAVRMGLADWFGNPIGGRTRWVAVRGVVAGASEKIPTVTLAYRIKGEAPVTTRILAYARTRSTAHTSIILPVSFYFYDHVVNRGL